MALAHTVPPPDVPTVDSVDPLADYGLTLSVEEAGALLGLSRGRAYRAVNRWLDTDGREGVPCVRIGPKRFVVPREGLRAWLHAQPVEVQT